MYHKGEKLQFKTGLGGACCMPIGDIAKEG